MTIDEEYARYQAAPKFNQYGEELYCICRKPDKGQLMICCDGCENWFHFRCLHLKNEWQLLVHKFYCQFCEHRGVGVSKWKRKCRLSWCFNPVVDSKYCSKEHGLIYIREALEQLADIKKIVNLVESYEHLTKLGQNLPEPPAVIAYHQGDLSQLPPDLAEELSNISSQITKLTSEQESIKAEVLQYNRIKDAIKQYNEAHKVKGKKSDICGYNRDETEIVDEEGQLKVDSVCLNDRRRCIHNCWLGLLFDEAYVLLERKAETKRKLENEVTQKLQQYLVSIYENEGVMPETTKEESNGDTVMADANTEVEGEADKKDEDIKSNNVTSESEKPVESQLSNNHDSAPMDIDDKPKDEEEQTTNGETTADQLPQTNTELKSEASSEDARPDGATRKPSIANLLS